MVGDFSWLGFAYIIPSENFPVPDEFFSCFPTHCTIHSKTTKAESKLQHKALRKQIFHISNDIFELQFAINC